MDAQHHASGMGEVMMTTPPSRVADPGVVEGRYVDPANPHWLLRARIEHRELCERLVKLTAFISSNSAFKGLDETDRNLLRTQRSAMRDYESPLSDRITRKR